MSLATNRTAGVGNASAVAAVAGVILLSSLLISLYVLILHHAAVRGNSEDAVQSAALTMARELATVTVRQPHFGNVGLCDILAETGGKSIRIRGLNTIYATLRSINIVARKLNLPLIGQLSSEDMVLARQVQKSLTEELVKRTQTIYPTICKIASEGKETADETLVDLRIRLGTMKSPQSSLVPPVGSDDEDDANYLTVDRSAYRSGVPIPVPGSSPVVFYPISTRSQIVDQTEFAHDESPAVPSVVLIEAIYRRPEQKLKADILRTHVACAIVGATPARFEPCIFQISFPHGIPSTFRKLDDLVHYSQWQHSGQWQQVVKGPIPGPGHLAPPLDLEAVEVMPAAAVQTALYHWFFQTGPALNPERVSQVLQKEWTLKRPDASLQINPNSALVKDTGARMFAFLHQSGPKQAGQDALKKAFDNSDEGRFPKAAFPLVIDENGNCNLPGRKGFDRSLIMGFLKELYQTNSASVESVILAGVIIERMEQATKALEQSAAMLREETDSISLQIEKNDPRTTGGSEEKSANLRQNLTNLTMRYNNQMQKIQEYKKIRERAESVLSHAENAARWTFDLGADMFLNARAGLAQTSSPPSAYLLSNKTLFVPHPIPVSEEAIYDSADKNSKPEQLVWFDPNFSVLFNALSGTVANGRTLSELLNSKPEVTTAPPAFVLCDSTGLRKDSVPTVLVHDRSPFTDIELPVHQMAFYSPDCIYTGSNQVGWSLLIRDLVARKLQNGGEPIASTQPRWCSSGGNLTGGQCPGLACELQIRAPVPVLPDLPVGSYLTNPQNKERTSQIPPLPATML